MEVVAVYIRSPHLFGYHFLFQSINQKCGTGGKAQNGLMGRRHLSYRAELVNHTESFFDQIRIEEGKRAAILGKAWQKVNEASLNEDVTFYVDIMSYNSTIPCILTDDKGNVNIAVNVPPEVNSISNIAELPNKSEYDSVILQYYRNHYNVMYYKESFLSTLLLLASVLVCTAQTNYFLDGIIGVVGKEVILKSDLEKVYAEYSNQYSLDEDEHDLKCQLMQQLVFQKLLIHQADLDSITITNDELDNTINYRMAMMIQQVGGNEKIIEDYYHKSIATTGTTL